MKLLQQSEVLPSKLHYWLLTRQLKQRGETGKLAEQSKQAANLIANMVVQMKARTGRAVELMQTGFLRAEKGKNLTLETIGTFERIFKSLKDSTSSCRCFIPGIFSSKTLGAF
jgi:hypothetical protein